MILRIIFVYNFIKVQGVYKMQFLFSLKKKQITKFDHSLVRFFVRIVRPNKKKKHCRVGTYGPRYTSMSRISRVQCYDNVV